MNPAVRVGVQVAQPGPVVVPANAGRGAVAGGVAQDGLAQRDTQAQAASLWRGRYRR
jgi:hypothetical protein